MDASLNLLFGIPFTPDCVWERRAKLCRVRGECQHSSSLTEQIKCQIGKIVLGGTFLNHHQRCCWSRMQLSSALTTITSDDSTPQQKAQEVTSCWRYAAEVSRNVKKKPLAPITIQYNNRMPSVLRSCEDDSNVYALYGNLTVDIVLDSGCLDESCVRGRALSAAPDFLVMSPSVDCSDYVKLDKSNKKLNSPVSQFLALQDVISDPSNAAHFCAVYSPFKWILSASGEQTFVNRDGERRVQKRLKVAESSMKDYAISLGFSMHAFYIPMTPATQQFLRRCESSPRTVVTEEQRFGFSYDPESTEAQTKRSHNAARSSVKRTRKSVDFLWQSFSSMEFEDAAESQENHWVLKDKICCVGVVYASRSITVEVCRSPNCNQLANVLPSGSRFPIRVALPTVGSKMSERELSPTALLDSVLW